MNKKRFVFLLLLLLWILFIFSHSLKPVEASNQESERVRQPLSQLVHHELSAVFVRKLAHFMEFGVLGVLAAGFFAARAGKPAPLLLHSAMLGMVIALCDETIQLFVAGRSGRIQDVWLDLAGALAGATLALTLLYLARKRRSRIHNAALPHFGPSGQDSSNIEM